MQDILVAVELGSQVAEVGIQAAVAAEEDIPGKVEVDILDKHPAEERIRAVVIEEDILAAELELDIHRVEEDFQSGEGIRDKCLVVEGNQCKDSAEDILNNLVVVVGGSMAEVGTLALRGWTRSEAQVMQVRQSWKQERSRLLRELKLAEGDQSEQHIDQLEEHQDE